MNTSSKRFFSSLASQDTFSKIIKKITIHESLSNEEWTYALALSILFYKEYQETEESSYLEFSYYLVLNYSLSTNDFVPLLTFSINNGLYPIAKCLYSQQELTLEDEIINREIDQYKTESIYEMLSQKTSREKLIKSEYPNRALIAPTSYGKSSIIFQDIEIHSSCFNKIGIIVPKKALIWQTYKNVKTIATKKNYKLLMHDTEYNNENRILCIFTQERALRLLQDNNIAFDILYIDEAHNLFDSDYRNVLLARLIKLNKKINPKQKVVYLSPLIGNPQNLSIFEDDFIETQKIDFNIKEYNIHYFDQGHNLFMYNRYINKYFPLGHKNYDWYGYINEMSGSKNLIYFRKPREIETYSILLADKIKNDAAYKANIHTENLNKVSLILQKYVNPYYHLADLVNFGIIYIHAKMPDGIKDYLLNEFANNPDFKYLVSNSSIFEGINLPIDRLFIMDTNNLKSNDLINLCGRVNRLNNIFTEGNINRLLCDIHFIGLQDKCKVDKKIQFLRHDISDTLNNPLLINTTDDEKKTKIAKIENDFILNYQSKSLERILVKNGLVDFYYDFDKAVSEISQRLQNNRDQINHQSSLIDKMQYLFIGSGGNIKDNSVGRLKFSQTINFYRTYLLVQCHLDLHSKINYFLNHFKKAKIKIFYIGTSFGEQKRSETDKSNAYIDISHKSSVELVNIAIIKSKIEDDFINFELNKMAKALLDLSIINQEEYDIFLYGTTNQKELSLLKLGLSPIIINFIKSNNLESEFTMHNGVIEPTALFMKTVEEADSYIKFEIKKYL